MSIQNAKWRAARLLGSSVVLAPAAGLLLGCSSSSPSGAAATPEIQAFSYLTNLILVDVAVDGATGRAYVDTGNPFVLLNPQTFPSAANLPSTGGDVPSMTIGTQTTNNVYALATTESLTSPDPAVPLAANVGCSGICPFVASFNYRDVAFALGPVAPTPPAGLQPATSFGFSFEGGSQVDGVTVPRSRVVVPVSIEGTVYSMVLDTGAGSVTVSQAVYTALTADGRTQLMGEVVETATGLSTSSSTRAASIVVNGVEVDSVVVSHDTSFDTVLASVSTDVGHTIDGSLGGDFLHDFYVTIDYPANTVSLARYSDLSFAVDQAEAIGLGLMQGGSGYTVSGVSSDVASRGVSAGDVVVAIDGVNLSGLALSQATLLLYGPVGSTKTVTFGAAAQVANQSLALVVEEFLPLPP